MSKNKTLDEFQSEIKECVKCGACQAHCPTYRTHRREGSVARGKIALAQALIDKEIEIDPSLMQDISMCLMCGSCMVKCPNKVPTHEIVGAMRREITGEKGLPPMARGITSVIGSQALLKAVTKGGAMVSPFLFKGVPESSGLRLRFPSPVMRDRTIPKLVFRNLFNLVPEFVKGDDDKPVIGFFAGCSISYVYPKIGQTMVRILHRMGFSVHVPRSQGCCGIPALSAGAGDLVERLAQNNVQSFGKYNEEYIVTACASCNGGVGEYYSTMGGDAARLSAKVIDFTVFLKEQGWLERFHAMEKWPERTRVTYHDPCHLKMQSITRQPRELLQALPNVEFVEMRGADLCCGLGGTFSVYHYESSKAIGARKVEGLLESGASKVATACPGCMMQLQDSINHADLKIEAIHILDLVDQVLDHLDQES